MCFFMLIFIVVFDLNHIIKLTDLTRYSKVSNLSINFFFAFFLKHYRHLIIFFILKKNELAQYIAWVPNLVNHLFLC